MKGKIKVFLAVEAVMLVVFTIVGYTMFRGLSHKYGNQAGNRDWKYRCDLMKHESMNHYCTRNGLAPYDEKSPGEMLQECIGAFANYSTDSGQCEGSYIIAKCYNKENKVVGEVGDIIQLIFQNDSDDIKYVYAYPDRSFSKEQMQQIYEFEEKHFSMEIDRLEGYYEGEEFVVTSMTVKKGGGGKATKTIEINTDHKTVEYTKEASGIGIYGSFLRTNAIARPVSYHGEGLTGVFEYLAERYEASRAKQIQAYNETKFKEQALGQQESVSAKWLEGTDGNSGKEEFTYKGETYQIAFSVMTDSDYVAIVDSWLPYNLAKIFYFLQAAAILFSILLYRVYKKRKHYEYSKVVLTNGVAHEMKTPLAVIKNYGECMEGQVNPEKDSYYLSSIINETDRMNAMIVNLLNYTRFSNEEYRIKKQLMALDELVIEVLKEKEEAIKQKKLEVTMNCTGSMEAICDGELIKMVIENYLTNAITYAPEEYKIEITIVQSRHLLRNRITCSIYNEGECLNSRDKQYIWDVFYRGDKARRRKENSTGFGLAICKHIIKLHKGKYGCENVYTGMNERNGVRFYFMIPTGIRKTK